MKVIFFNVSLVYFHKSHPEWKRFLERGMRGRSIKAIYFPSEIPLSSLENSQILCQLNEASWAHVNRTHVHQCGHSSQKERWWNGSRIGRESSKAGRKRPFPVGSDCALENSPVPPLLLVLPCNWAIVAPASAGHSAGLVWPGEPLGCLLSCGAFLATMAFALLK